jgi:hypothetical protein
MSGAVEEPLSMTLAWPPAIAATQAFVVPRSMPIAYAAISQALPFRAAVESR